MLYGAMNFPIRPVLDEIHAIGSLGLDYIELAMDPPEAHYLHLREQRDAIHQALDHYRMALIDALKQIHYDDTMTLEIFTEDRTDLIRSRNALQRIMDSGESLWPST